MKDFRIVAEEDLFQFEKACNEYFQNGWEMTGSYAMDLTAIATFEREKPQDKVLVPEEIILNKRYHGMVIRFQRKSTSLEVLLTKDQFKEIQEWTLKP